MMKKGKAVIIVDIESILFNTGTQIQVNQINKMEKQL